MPSSSDQASRALLGRFLAKLRFPQLFTLAAALFVVDLVVPDLIPFVDEVLLAAATYLLANLRKPEGVSAPPDGPKPPMKDITPPED